MCRPGGYTHTSLTSSEPRSHSPEADLTLSCCPVPAGPRDGACVPSSHEFGLHPLVEAWPLSHSGRVFSWNVTAAGMPAQCQVCLERQGDRWPLGSTAWLFTENPVG